MWIMRKQRSFIWKPNNSRVVVGWPPSRRVSTFALNASVLKPHWISLSWFALYASRSIWFAPSCWPTTLKGTSKFIISTIIIAWYSDKNYGLGMGFSGFLDFAMKRFIHYSPCCNRAWLNRSHFLSGLLCGLYYRVYHCDSRTPQGSGSPPESVRDLVYKYRIIYIININTN